MNECHDCSNYAAPKPRILLIEDEHPYCELMVARLGDTYEVVCANMIAEGMSLLREKGPFDLVLLDLILPDSNLETSLPLFLKHFPNQPPIVISGYSEPNFVARMIRLGARGYLIKGRDDLDTKTLLSRLNMIILHGRTTAQLSAAQIQLTKLGNELSRFSAEDI